MVNIIRRTPCANVGGLSPVRQRLVTRISSGWDTMFGRSSARTWTLGLICLGLAWGPVGRADEPLTATRTALAKLVETQQLISREEGDWRLEQEILKERIALMQREVDALRERIAEAQSSMTGADEKRAALIAENDTLKATATQLTEAVTSLESSTRSLTTRLPDPLATRLKPLSQRLPSDKTAELPSLSERFQNVIGILNEVTKFNGEVTTTREVITLANGRVAQVQTLYLGLGQAYFVSAHGDAAGIGQPGETAWRWDETDQLAGHVAEAIAILQNEKVAAFVPLPVEIK